MTQNGLFLILKLHVLLLQVGHVRLLFLCQKEKTFSGSARPGRPTNPMHKLVAPLGRIKLNNPVDVGDVNSARRQVRCQQDCTRIIQNQVVFFKVYLFEFVVHFGSFLLVDLPVQLRHQMLLVQLFEKTGDGCLMIIYTCASRKEDDYSFLGSRVYKIYQSRKLVCLVCND